MKAEELMIGDWVLVDRYHQMRITKLSQYGEYPDCEPIPLTPEILEKNGFRKDDETDQWYFKSKNRLDLGLLAVGIDDGCGVGLCVMRNGAITYYCKYVHELQHFLRLIGGAKEIMI